MAARGRAAREREELAVAVGVRLAVVVKPLRLPVDRAQCKVALSEEVDALLPVDDLRVAVEVEVQHILEICLVRVRIGRRRSRTRPVTGDVTNRGAIHGRDIAGAGHRVDHGIGVQVGAAAARERAPCQDRTVFAVDAIAAGAVKHIIFRTAEEVAVSKKQRLLHVPLTGQHDVALVEVPAGETGQGERFPAAAWHARGEIDLGAVDTFPGDHVDHAGDRVRAVNRRRAVLHDFNALDGSGRQHVEVKCAHLATRSCRAGPLAVQQYQGAVRPKTAQRQRLHAGTTFHHETGELVADLGGAGSDAGLLQELRGVHLAKRHVGVGGDDLDRRRRLIFGPAQERPGHGDAVQLRRALLRLVLFRFNLGFVQLCGGGRVGIFLYLPPGFGQGIGSPEASGHGNRQRQRLQVTTFTVCSFHTSPLSHGVNTPLTVEYRFLYCR